MLKNLFISSFYEEISPQEWNLLENEARKIKGEFLFWQVKMKWVTILTKYKHSTKQYIKYSEKKEIAA